jgi:DNA-directed RNA polymerase subunit RPC12/RpoP
MRRLRRRQATTHRLFCSTNGCASFLELDPEGRVATCPICGYRRLLH